MENALSNGEPEIPPDSPTEIPPAPPDIPPGGPVEVPPPPSEIPPAPPHEVPPPPQERIRLAAAAHEVSQELGDFGVLVHGGWPSRRALLFNVLSGSTFLLGGLVTYALSFRMDVSWLIPYVEHSAPTKQRGT